MTIVVPIANKSPGSWVLVIFTPVQVPLGVGGVQVTTAPHTPASLLTVISKGQFAKETEHSAVDPIPY